WMQQSGGLHGPQLRLLQHRQLRRLHQQTLVHGSKQASRSEAVRESRMFTDMALAEALTDRRLDLIILPTEKCNFRCTYCYEDFAQGKMAAKLIAGIKALIDSRLDTVQHVSLAWFGG